MSQMDDKAHYQFICDIDAVDWSLYPEITHNDYTWLNVRGPKETFECKVYYKKRLIRDSLKTNERVDKAPLHTVSVHGITSIPRYVIIENDVLYTPIGTQWAQIRVNNHSKAIAITTFNNIIRITVQCTFDCNNSIALPPGLPLFDTKVEKIIGFVGKRLRNGLYVVDATSNQKISKKIMSNEKIYIHFNDMIKSSKSTNRMVKSQKRIVIYGNILFTDGITTEEIRKLETRYSTCDQEKRINVYQTETGVIINITNSPDDEDSDELESFVFTNTKSTQYFVLHPTEELVLDEEELLVPMKKKSKKR